MPNVTGPSGNRPTIPLSELQGKELPRGAEKVAETVSSKIELATELSPGIYIPDLKISSRTVKDPEPREKIIDVPQERLSQIKTAEEFKALLKELQEEHKSYLLPDRREFAEKAGDSSHYAYNSVTGRRIEKFFDEVASLIGKTQLRGAEAKAARKAVNLAHADAYRGRDIKFDRANTGTYWSYGHDAAFVHVYEKMLEALPENDPRREAIQNQIDFIFTNKYTPSGKVDENNIEKSLELVAIDKDSRHVVSMTKDSVNSPRPKYETIQIDPRIASSHGGKYVYWDSKADKYFFEGTREEVPPELHSKFIRKPVREVVFRRPKEGEELREGFRFDWNGNRMINTDKIDTSWWGHCDIKAIIEASNADMKGLKGIKEFRSDTGKVVEYSRSDILEILASQLNMGGEYIELGTGREVYFGENKFGGARFNDEPDKLYLRMNGNYKGFNLRIESMSEPGKPDKMVDVEESFQKFKLGEDGKSFVENEELLQTIAGDTGVLDGSDRLIKAKAEYYTVNEFGQWVENKDTITLDPNKDEKVLIGTDIVDISDRKLTRYYFNPKTKELFSADVTFVKEDGKFVPKEENMRLVGRSSQMLLTKELQAGDDVEGKVDLVRDAIRTGTAIATDSDTGMEVWNGAVYNIREEVAWRSEDGKFEKINIYVDAVYGSGKVGSRINQLDEEGNVVKSFETDAVVDFFWRNRPRVAPLIRENGKWYVNKAMYERGLIDLNDVETSLEAFKDLNDLLYLGLTAKDNQEIYTIVHNGKRLVYDSKEAWEADVAKLKGTEPTE